MTFSAWYDSTVKPQLEETLKSMPIEAREPLRTASRMSMAACWNAALEATKGKFPVGCESGTCHLIDRDFTLSELRA